jgi:hypothetical protein
MACLHAPPWHGPPPEVERFLMMDYVPTRARSKGVVCTPTRGWGQAEATLAMALSVSPPPIADGVDKLYHQVAEIHAIATAQLPECAHWRHSDSDPSPIWVGTGR